MNARQETLAYLVWAHCQPIGWDITMSQCADAIGAPLGRVRGVVQVKGWSGRFRSVLFDEAGLIFGQRSRGVSRTYLDEVAEVPRAFAVAE